MSRKNNYWLPQHEPHVRAVLSRMLKRFTGTGFAYTDQHMIDKAALRQLIQAPSHSLLISNSISWAVQQMSASGNVDLEVFSRCLETRLQYHRDESISKSAPFWAIMPFRMPIGQMTSRMLHIPLMGIDFRLMTINDLRRYLGDSTLELDAYTQRAAVDKSLPATCLCAAGYGFPIEHSFDRIGDAIDVLRGAMELCASFGSRTWGLGSHSRRGRFPHPKHAIIVRRGQPVWTLSFREQDWTLPSHLSSIQGETGDQFIERVIRFCGSIPASHEPHSTHSLLADSLRLYASALSQEIASECLVGLWQVAEAITLEPSDRGDGDKVAKRLATIWRIIHDEPEETAAIALRGIKDIRNAIVHKGHHYLASDDDINILKSACECAISWLLNHLSMFPTRSHLMAWWRLRGTPHRELGVLIDVCKHVQNDRSADEGKAE